MKINPKSDQDFKSRNLKAGIYEFTIFDAVEKLSQKTGEPMIEIILSIVDENQREHKIFDYLMDKEPWDYKIKHLYKSVGMLEQYNSGDINAEELHNKVGTVKIAIRKDKSGVYGDRPGVQDYLETTSNKVDNDLNDPIPF